MPGFFTLRLPFQNGKCGFLNEVVSFYRRHQGGVWGGATILDKLRYTWKITDTMDEYFSGKSTRSLFDRELWIYKSETSIHIGKDFWKHWFQSLSIVRLSFSRMIKVLPIHYLAFASQVWLQPFTAAYLTFRRKLALRNRFATLKGIIACFKYGF